MKYIIKITNKNNERNHRWRGKNKIEDSLVMIDGNIVAEFVWFELKENAAET